MTAAHPESDRAGDAPVPAAGSGSRFVALEVFRAVAAPLVVYSHVVFWLQEKQNTSSPVVDLVDGLARNPLHLEQHLGHLAVVLFFLVSGFIVTHAGIGDRHHEFAVKRVFRIYPALFAAVLLSAALLTLGLEPLTSDAATTVSPFTILTNATLVNYLLVPQVVLVGVAWTLIIEVLFYSLTFLLLPLLRRTVSVAILLELLLIALVVLTARAAGPNWFLFAVSFSYLPVLVLGQIVWAVWSGRIPLRLGALLGSGAWLIYVWAAQRDMGRIDNAYELTLVIGLLLFVIGILAEPKLRLTPLVNWLATRSYSTYLLHGLVAFPLMDLLIPVVPLWLTVLLAFAVLAGAVDLSYRWIERPAQRLARILLTRYAPASPSSSGSSSSGRNGRRPASPSSDR